MEPRLDYIRQLVRERDWSGSEFARQMGVSRAEANRFLNGQRKGGNKLISGLLQAFPGESLESLFILPTMEPIVNINEIISAYKVRSVKLHDEQLPASNAGKRKMKPVRHPNAHQIACSIDEAAGTVEIVDGKNITMLIVPIGPIEVRHTTKPKADTS